MATHQQQTLVWVEPSSDTAKKDANGSFASRFARLGKAPSAGDIGELKASRNRFSRIFHRDGQDSKAPQATDNDSGATKTAAQHRREQVYQAQKRHRNRRAAYVQTLENEVARLKHLDAVASNEKHALEKQNREMLALLEAANLNAEPFATLSAAAASFPDAIMHDFDVDIRLDELIGHERTFLDLPSMTSDLTTPPTLYSSSATSQQTNTPVPPTNSPDESWAAADFILALEWPCRDHIHHSVLNPPPTLVGPTPNAEDGHGHALTTTAAVFDCSLPAVTTSKIDSTSNATARDMVLPYLEIEKLVRLSELLPLDEVSLTPAQAYAAIHRHMPQELDLYSVLSALKIPLSQSVSCQGFGAVMSTEDFWYHFRQIMPSH